MSLETITHLQLVRASGKDAKTFLQGQLSNDINALNSGWQFSAYCTPKGRALAVFIMWQHNEHIYILCEKDLSEIVLKRLRMYVMRSKVVFENLDASVTGAFKQNDFEQISTPGNINAERYSTTKDDKCHILSFGNRSLIIDSVEVHHDSSSNEACDVAIVKESAGEKTDSSMESVWIATDIQEALPRVTKDSSQMFIPQMLNMDVLNGISFKKGCYTGQEIIARMHYLGKLKQRSFVCQIENACPPKPGAKIINSDGKTVGNVVNSIHNSKLILAALRFDKPGHDATDQDSGPKQTNYFIGADLLLESGDRVTVLETQPYELSAS